MSSGYIVFFIGERLEFKVHLMIQLSVLLLILWLITTCALMCVATVTEL